MSRGVGGVGSGAGRRVRWRRARTKEQIKQREHTPRTVAVPHWGRPDSARQSTSRTVHRTARDAAIPCTVQRSASDTAEHTARATCQYPTWQRIPHSGRRSTPIRRNTSARHGSTPCGRAAHTVHGVAHPARCIVLRAMQPYPARYSPAHPTQRNTSRARHASILCGSTPPQWTAEYTHTAEHTHTAERICATWQYPMWQSSPHCARRSASRMAQRIPHGAAHPAWCSAAQRSVAHRPSGAVAANQRPSIHPGYAW